ncbi:hypothetical protein Tco_0792576 [Tanacetum coccineum]
MRKQCEYRIYSDVTRYTKDKINSSASENFDKKIIIAKRKEKEKQGPLCMALPEVPKSSESIRDSWSRVRLYLLRCKSENSLVLYSSAWSQISYYEDQTRIGSRSSFDDLYNNLRVFENDVKCSTASSSSTQNVAFVSENTSSTNDVSTAYSASNTSGQNSIGKSKIIGGEMLGTLGNKDGCREPGRRGSKACDDIDGEMVVILDQSLRKKMKIIALMAFAKHSESDSENNLVTKHRNKGVTQGLRYDGILSYENEVLQSVFMNKESELEKQPLYDRFVTAGGMHVVPPPMTGNYMPSGPDIEVDYSQFTYGPKQTQPSESESQSSEFDTCESNISTEPSELVSEPVVNESNVECQPKVWSDAPIIEEYESDSEDEYVSIPTKEQETPSFANQQVKTPRETVKNQFTHSQKPKVDKKELGYGFTVRACFVCGSLNHLIRDCDFHEKRMARKAELNNGWNRKSSEREIRQTWNNVQRVNKQNQFVPSAVLTRTAMKVNTVKPIVNRVRPANVFHKTHSPSSRPFKKTTVLSTNFSKQKVNTAKVNAVSAVEGKRETAVKPSAGCNWRPQRYNWHNISKYNGGSSLRNGYTFKDPLGRLERITKKRTKNKAKTTKPDSEWKRLGSWEKKMNLSRLAFILANMIKRQEKDANDEAEALRKEFAQETENLLIQAGAAKASSTNIMSVKCPGLDYFGDFVTLEWSSLVNCSIWVSKFLSEALWFLVLISAFS